MDIRINETWKQESGKYKCPHCNKDYSRNGISTHIWRSHGQGKDHNPNEKRKKDSYVAWNKGLTKETNDSVRKGGETYSQRIKDGEIEASWKGKKHKKETIQSISSSMIKAHEDGRAWNIGMSRWNNEPSYPEQFFMKVIENEFEDKNYKPEHPFGIYAIDFAWIHKKKAIEIDGEQHERFEEYRERDKRKDKLLNENGWKVLRIKWKDMFNNTKEQIEIAKNFIDERDYRLR